MTRLALIAVLALPGCSQLSEAFSSGEQPEFRSHVQVIEVGRQRVERTLELTGTVEAGRSVSLMPLQAGKIASLPVKVGQQVSQGEVLARMDTDIVRLQLDQAEAAVKLGELGLRTARSDFQRVDALHNSGSIPAQQFEQAKAGLDMAELQVAQARAALGLVREAMEGAVLTAPFDGVVSFVGGEEGNLYNPMSMSLGGPSGLVGVVQLDRVRMDLKVSDRDVVLIREGMDAHIFVDSAEQALPDGLQATVESVGQAADAGSRTFPVRLVADNPGQQVRAGVHGRANLVLEAKDGIAVPESALLSSGEQTLVMVVKDGVASRAVVQTGLHGTRWVEISSGLSGGEIVAVDGNFGLPDGALVEVVGEDGKPLAEAEQE